MAANTIEEWQAVTTDCLVELLSTSEGQAIFAAKSRELDEVSSARSTARGVLRRLDEIFGPLYDQVEVLQDAEDERQRREVAKEHRLRRAEYNRRRSEERKQARAKRQPTELMLVATAAD